MDHLWIIKGISGSLCINRQQLENKQQGQVTSYDPYYMGQEATLGSNYFRQQRQLINPSNLVKFLFKTSPHVLNKVIHR